jgi:ubiquinone/menaquinone biosynthesis C-methylase UbiE
MSDHGELTPEEQTAILADRYSQRAEAYDSLWSPIIRPAGERLIGNLPLSRTGNVIDIGTGAGALLPAIQRAAPGARVLGVDRSAGMLRLARQKHSGPLALMDVQKLGLPSDRFDAAVVAFVLFHLPYPEHCLMEVNRVLKPGGTVGTVTWGLENMPPAHLVWDEELEAAGARILELPATDNRPCCDNTLKMKALLDQAGFASIKVWIESIEHPWHPDVYFDYQVRSTSRLRLQSLSAHDREACLGRVRDRLSSMSEEQYVYRGEVVIATAVKADNAGVPSPDNNTKARLA